jgi:hypothetical protein
MDAQGPVVVEDVQVAAKPRRRTFTAEYKRRILKEADACTTAGAVGALLRQEGLYSSHLVIGRGSAASWRPWLRRRGGASWPRSIPETGRSLNSSGNWRR